MGGTRPKLWGAGRSSRLGRSSRWSVLPGSEGWTGTGTPDLSRSGIRLPTRLPVFQSRVPSGPRHPLPHPLRHSRRRARIPQAGRAGAGGPPGAGGCSSLPSPRCSLLAAMPASGSHSPCGGGAGTRLGCVVGWGRHRVPGQSFRTWALIDGQLYDRLGLKPGSLEVTGDFRKN